jgi:uncharacterized HAD superfamily protein
MKRIGIDIDEVLSETVVGFLSFYNGLHGTNFTYDDIKEYSFSKMLGLSIEEEQTNLKKYFSSDIFMNVAPIQGSVEAIKSLSEKYDLYAISSRPPTLNDITTGWLGRHFGNSFKEVHLTNSHFDSSSKKSTVCIDKHLDYFIEDAIDYAQDCANACIKVFLLDKPWNRVITESKNIVRVKDWAEIESYLLEERER